MNIRCSSPAITTLAPNARPRSAGDTSTRENAWPPPSACSDPRRLRHNLNSTCRWCRISSEDLRRVELPQFVEWRGQRVAEPGDVRVARASDAAIDDHPRRRHSLQTPDLSSQPRASASSMWPRHANEERTRSAHVSDPGMLVRHPFEQRTCMVCPKRGDIQSTSLICAPHGPGPARTRPS
eukprot:2674761-Rhodomonas_salina.1